MQKLRLRPGDLVVRWTREADGTECIAEHGISSGPDERSVTLVFWSRRGMRTYTERNVNTLLKSGTWKL